MLDCARLACLLELGVAEGGRAPGGACGVSAVHQHGCDMHRFRRIKLTRAWSATSSFSKQKVPGTTKAIETLDFPVQWMIVIFTQWQLDKDVICRSAMFGAGSPSHAISKRRPCKLVCGTCRPIVRRRLRGPPKLQESLSPLQKDSLLGILA